MPASSAAAPSGAYQTGVAVIDVTPPVGTLLTGYAARKEPSTGVYLPLRATVVALTDPLTDCTLLLVNAEWLGFYNRTATVRDHLGAATGVPRDHILLCGTHTHCGPALRTRLAPDDCWEDPNECFLADVFARLARAAKDAMADREPVSLHTSTGWCGFAHSRRKPNGRGGVEWAPSLDAPHDHTVPLLLAKRGDGSAKLLLFGYACHPTSAGAILEIGGDYPGFARAELEQTLGCSCVFLLGCAGDQKPWRPVSGESEFPSYPLPAVKQFGHELAQAVRRETDFGRWLPLTGALRVRQRTLHLTMQTLNQADYAAMRGHENPWFDRWARLNLASLQGGVPRPTTLPFEIQTVSCGNSFALVAMAGEMNVGYGLRLLKELGATYQQLWPIGYANAIAGYLPTERQLPEGGYEVIGSQMTLGRVGPLASGTEEQIVAAVRELLPGSP